ncbi:MAG: hypothetical protein LBO62_07545, partial [Endomicrobium sp.]|nr:hypothetical protein [Endomicrobium sp.]
MKKIVSIIVSACFLFSAVFAEAAVSVLPQTQAIELLRNSSSVLPSNIGKIVESQTFENSPYTIISVQDLHCNSEVQSNIEQIIANLIKNYKISAVFVEGGYGIVDPGAAFENIRDKSVKSDIIDTLFNYGRLTGTERYYLKNKTEIPLIGLEDRQIHKENLARLSKTIGNVAKYGEILSALKSDIDYLKAKYLSRENLKFSKTADDYKSGKLSDKKYYVLLKKYINKINNADRDYNPLLPLAFEKYPEFTNYCALLEESGSINYNKVVSEMQILVNVLKNKLPYLYYNNLSLTTAGFSNIEELAARLPEISEKYSINFNYSSDLGLFIKYILAKKTINPIKLIEEERRIAEDIRMSFSQNGQELEISFLSDFYVYLSNFLNAKISADDYDFFEKEYPRFEEIYSKYAYKNVLTHISDDIKFLNEFYAVNKDRNLIFFKEIAANVKDGGLAIVITGGFHSKGLNKLFSQNGVSYINVMPQARKETQTSEEAYNEYLIMGSAFDSETPQTLSTAIASRNAASPAAIETQTLALALATQSSNAEFAAIMADIAIKDLSSAVYGRENIEILLKSLNEILGQKLQYNFSDTKTEIALSQDFKITLGNENGTIVLLSQAQNAQGAKKPNRFAEIFGVAKKIFALSSKSSLIVNPNVSAIIKNLAKYTAENNIVTGDGLIFDIEIDTNLPEVLDGIGKNVIARMPDTVQNALLNAYKRDALLNSQERIFARAFLEAYRALGYDKSVLDIFFKPAPILETKNRKAANIEDADTQTTETELLIAEAAKASGIERFDISIFDDKIVSREGIAENTKKIAAAVEENKLLAITFEQKLGETHLEYYRRVVRNIRVFSQAADASFLRGYPMYQGKLLAIKELIRNAFAHGNHLNGKKYVYLHLNDYERAVTVINEQQKKNFYTEGEHALLAKRAGVFGQERGVGNLARDYGYFKVLPTDNPVITLANGKEIFKVDFIIDVNFPAYGSLELPFSAKLVDFLALKGWARALFVS